MKVAPQFGIMMTTYEFWKRSYRKKLIEKGVIRDKESKKDLYVSDADFSANLP